MIPGKIKSGHCDMILLGNLRVWMLLWSKPEATKKETRVSFLKIK
jgi:hypothetical protein